MTSASQQPVEGNVVAKRVRTEHIYGLPIVGPQANKVRDFYDELEPEEEDGRGKRAGKNALRYGSVAVVGAGATAVAAVLML